MPEHPGACPACGGTTLIKSGHTCGRQRWRWEGCGRQFTRTTPRGNPAAMKREAVGLCCSGLSLNATGKRLGVPAQSVMRRVRDHAREHCPSRSRPGGRSWSRSTRSGTSSKKAGKLWIWKALGRGTGRLIDWECGGRDQATLERLLGRLEPWGVRLFRTDDWPPYDAALPAGRHYVGKDQTHTRAAELAGGQPAKAPACPLCGQRRASPCSHIAHKAGHPPGLCEQRAAKCLKKWWAHKGSNL